MTKAAFVRARRQHRLPALAVRSGVSFRWCLEQRAILRADATATSSDLSFVEFNPRLPESCSELHCFAFCVHRHRMTKTTFRIGCAGWSLPRSAAASFPEIGSHLERYSAVFSAAEINSSFYRSHRLETYARWASAVPTSFRFSVKLPKEITHTLRLKACARPLRKFVSEIAGLGSRLGCVLIQLPPSFAFQRAVVRQFLTLLRRHFDGDAVLEPRHITWFDPHVEAIFREFNVSQVASDPAVCAAAARPSVGSSVTYFRLHGSPRMYYSNYDERYLRVVAAALKRNDVKSQQAWCIFDNTAHGFATTNALRLMMLLRGP